MIVVKYKDLKQVPVNVANVFKALYHIIITKQLVFNNLWVVPSWVWLQHIVLMCAKYWYCSVCTTRLCSCLLFLHYIFLSSHCSSCVFVSFSVYTVSVVFSLHVFVFSLTVCSYARVSLGLLSFLVCLHDYTVSYVFSVHVFVFSLFLFFFFCTTLSPLFDLVFSRCCLHASWQHQIEHS